MSRAPHPWASGGREREPKTTVWSLLRKEASLSKPFLLVSVLSLLVSFVAPFALQAVIDRVIVFKVPATLISITAILVIAGIFEAILNHLRGRLAGFASGRATARLATAVVDAALRQPTTNLLGSKGREIIGTLGEFNFFRDSVTQLVTYGVQLLFSVLFYLFIMMLLNPTMTLAVLLTLPFHALIYWVLTRNTKEKVRRSVASNSEFIASTQTAVSAIETIHAYGLARKQIDISKRQIVDALFRGFEARDATNTAQSISRLISRLTEAAVIFLGAAAVMRNELTLGQLVVFQLLLGRMVQPISQAGVSWDRFYRLRTIANEWQKLIDGKAAPAPASTAQMDRSGPLLVADALSVQYPGARAPTLQNVNIRIDGGETVFLLGPSGSGKSTLVRLLTGVVPSTSGTVAVHGLSPTGVPEEDRRKLVAAAFQEPVLLPGTIAENIASSDVHMPFERIERAAITAGAAQFIENLPDGYETLVGTTGYSVSGGERQRICLARMLACDASVMIIDEGTSGLQRSLEVEVIERINAELRPDQALIIITHREDLMRLGTRAIRMDAGQIIDDRPVARPSANEPGVKA